MVYDELKSLIDHLDASSVSYVQYETEEEQIILSKETPYLTPAGPSPADSDVETQAERPPVQADAGREETSAEEPVTSGQTVDSPIVGVAYLQAQPNDPPFVKVGDEVKEGQVVMIVEAMKLMNEIQATTSGVVSEILVDNEEVVEFGQPLIRIQ